MKPALPIIAPIIAIALLTAASALAQDTGRPAADPLAVKPVPSQAERPESDSIRTKIEQAGYTDVTDLSRDSLGVWRARGRKGGEPVDIVVDKGGRIKAGAR
jgi:hypothetical protein